MVSMFAYSCDGSKACGFACLLGHVTGQGLK